jgi:hypothetical protein
MDGLQLGLPRRDDESVLLRVRPEQDDGRPLRRRLMIGGAGVIMFGFFALVAVAGFSVLTLLDARRGRTL